MTASAQGFWLTTRDFPGGPKTAFTGLEDSILVVGTPNGIWRSTNEGFSWERSRPTSYIYTLYTSSSGTIVAGGSSKLFFSYDKGVTWDSVAVPTSYPIRKIVENRDHEFFFIASGFTNEEGFVGDGVFYNSGDLKDWVKRNSGLPPSLLAAEQLNTDKNGRIYVTLPDENTTGTGGLYYSDNKGVSWQQSPLFLNNLGTIKVLNSFAINITPQDSIIVSINGTAVNISTQLNVIKHINDVANNSAWRPWRIRKTGNWWEDIALNTIHFSRTGDWYSSVSSTISTGGAFYSTDNGTNWIKQTQGLGISATDRYENNFHYESSAGKLFMVQALDERVYYTNNTLLNPIVLSGNIKDNLGNALVGVTLSVKNVLTATNAQGDYSVVVPSGWSGKIMPTISNYIFNPESVSLTSAQESIGDINFVGTYVGTYFVSGYVRDMNGQPISQILVTGFPQNVYTNELGYYIAEVPAQWAGTITPMFNGYYSSPSSILVLDLESNRVGQNFILRKTGVVYILGKVNDENGKPFIDATLTGFPETTRIDALGNFYGEIPLGWSGIITPVAEGYKFSPDKIQVNNLQGDLLDQVFVASIAPVVTKYTLSGLITDSQGTPLGNLPLSGFPEEVRTASDGSYGLELPIGWSGVITPVSDTYTFTPSAITIENLSASLRNQNFIGKVITGIDDEQLSFSVYPNPTSDGFIYASAKFDGSVRIFNSSGQAIWHGESKDLSLNGLQLPRSGIYFFQWSDNTKNTQTIKVVVH
jgi:hypothetical protein